MKVKLRKLEIPELLRLVSSDKRWTARMTRKFEKRTTEQGQRRYLMGTHERWVKERKAKSEAYKKAQFQKRFVQGGLVNPR